MFEVNGQAEKVMVARTGWHRKKWQPHSDGAAFEKELTFDLLTVQAQTYPHPKSPF